MKTICHLALAACLLTALASCQNQAPAFGPPTCNFYYWKTTLDFGKSDQALADSMGMQKLYLRYFDVDWSPTLEMPVPVGELVVEKWGSNIWQFNTDAQIADYQLVPTIFITNRVFQQPSDLDSLAARISRKINDFSQGLNWKVNPGWGNYAADPEITDWEQKDSLWQLQDTLFRSRMTEIQIDCDWTPSTRQAYFSFLEKMQAANPGIDLTCTVRLHQFRDREQTGIPPVGRATLMCYNLAPPAELATADAIFDPALVEGYLKNADYPLPLEAALPLFSWGALFHENQFRGLASGLSAAEVEGNPLFEPLGQGRYRFTQDTVFADVYLRQGDLLRLDGPTTDELLALAGRLRQIKAVKSISFFDWNPDKIRAYHVDEIFAKFSE